MAKNKEKKINSSDEMDNNQENTKDSIDEESFAESSLEETELTKKDAIINALKEKNQEYLFLAQRIQAEFDNFRKRNEEIKNCVKFDTINDLISDLLLVLDSIDSALAFISNKQSIDGVLLIKRQILSILAKYDVQEIVAEGEIFNPERHDAIMQEEREECESGRILEVFKKGYIRKGKVIRYATVKVAV